MILTSTKKVLLITLVLIGFASTVSADFYYNNGGSPISDEDYFTLPEYDSQQEIATQLVAPFLLITILLQIGIERALYFTLDTSGLPTQNKTEKKKAKKQATIIALMIAGMMVPTPIFQSMNSAVSWIFGGALYILFGIAFVYFLYRLVTDLW